MYQAKQNTRTTTDRSEPKFQFVQELSDQKLSARLSENKKEIAALFSDCSDCAMKELRLSDGTKAFLILIDGLVDTNLVNRSIEVLMEKASFNDQVLHFSKEERFGSIVKHLPVSQTMEVDDLSALTLGILGGDTALLLEGSEAALLLSMRGPTLRGIEEPASEAVVRGPREGFTESLRTNTSMIRRKLRTPHLKMRSYTIGNHSNTGLVVAFVDGLVDPSIVKEVEARLDKIKLDGVLESGYIEEFIQDSTFSPFPQVQYTERPDAAAAALLQGRIAIVTDGTPFVLLVPVVFTELLQATEDYYERFMISSLLRLLRYLFLFLSLFTPAIYIALTTFHPEMIPTQLLLSIAASREPIPFPAVVEAFIMEVTFEALREAGIRLPKTIGQTVSILGALVVGQAAVEAGIVSAPMVIVVAITGIASFTIPRFNGAIAIRMLRFPLMVMASLFGIVGIIMGMMFILAHMAGLRSFGVPYMSPAAPANVRGLMDVYMRVPWPFHRKRPSFFQPLDEQRLDNKVSDQIMKEGGQKGAQEHEEDKS